MTEIKPVVQAEMLIRRPVEEVFEAFIDPEITTKFWFTKSSGRMEAGRRIRWDWEMYGVSDEIHVLEIEPNKRIRIESSDGTQTEWSFTSRAEQEAFITITNTGFTGSTEDIVNQALDSMGGYTMVLCALKALLEHGISLNLVADRAPDAHVTQ
ncbi:SRPBCC family protein [Brevibacillus invocatus]|uniref:SRPBCC family protein n=1 Tax=Brevibacillus invocatus TaxID=173959 RepID=UPI00203CA350|nr:SRPBCC family protein [Brevibacillus invocatus]MCM3079004.1 SRPBCC family protein [Brevibacillus invocatus]MCM3432067.1 SRPBCC family protein [Brevibacillus invocatus]